MSRYTKQHHEDVAKRLKAHMGHVMGCLKSHRSEGWCPPNLAGEFADLFAADNPANVYCGYCGTTGGNPSAILCPERGLDRVHSFVYHKGFDRERFLAACGLVTEPNCPLCSCPSENGDVHPSCADTEQAYSDYVAGKIAGEFE